MKIFSLLKKLVKNFFIILILTLFIQFTAQNQYAQAMNDNNGIILEELRLNVPYKYKDTWIQAEKEIWEPWLNKQEGFLGRQIFYNDKKEEALLLVTWKNKYLWKNISSAEVNKIQINFEENVKKSLKIDSNPFKFIYEGELHKEG
tara:strand:+ start:250 stop:687 length:438 start_codon:yes stop_codon:yes gene_type:complete